MNTIFEQTNQPGMKEVFGNFYTKPGIIKKLTNTTHNLTFYKWVRLPSTLVALGYTLMYFLGIPFAQDVAMLYTLLGLAVICQLAQTYGHIRAGRLFQHLSKSFEKREAAIKIDETIFDTIRGNLHLLSMSNSNSFTFPADKLGYEELASSQSHIDIRFIPKGQVKKDKTKDDTLYFFYDSATSKAYLMLDLLPHQEYLLRQLSEEGVITAN